MLNLPCVLAKFPGTDEQRITSLGSVDSPPTKCPGTASSASVHTHAVRRPSTPPALRASDNHTEPHLRLRSFYSDRETRFAHARTNCRSRISDTYRQLIGLPGRSSRRLQARNCTRTARDSRIWGQVGRGPFEPLTCDLTETHPCSMAQRQLRP